MRDLIFKMNIDPIAHNTKPTGGEIGAINNRVIKEENCKELTFDEFVKEVTEQGKTFLPSHFSNETRRNANWEYQFMYCLDIEHGETLEEALDTCKTYNIMPNLIYKTFSHKEEDHRFRIIWFMEEVIDDVRLQKFIQLGLMRFFKGSDRACKDRTRMFNGSNAGPWYVNKETLLTVPNLFLALNNLFRQDNNATKNTLQFAKSVGVNLVNGYLDCKVENEEMAEDLTRPCMYIGNKEKGKNYPYSIDRRPVKNYSINFSNNYTTAEQETYEIEKIENKKQKVRNFDFLLLNGKCQLFREALELTHKVEHDEMFGMFTNLLTIQGSEKYIKKIIDNILKTTTKTQEEKLTNINNTIKQIKKVGYEPMKCCNFCPFYGMCNSESNMIEHTRTMKNTATRVKNEVQIRDVEEVRADLENIFNDFINKNTFDSTSLTVVKAPTGTGKTEAFIKIVDKCEKLVYAAPTHKLLRNVADRLTAAGYRENIDFMVYPELPEEFEGKELIEKLYACGAHRRAGAELHKIAKRDENIKNYLDAKRRCENFDKLILITHQRFIYSPLKTEPKKYIIDEDILLNTMFPIQRVKVTDLLEVVEFVNSIEYSNKRAIQSLYTTVNRQQPCIVSETPRIIVEDKDELIKILLPLIKDNIISSNLLNFLTSELYVKDADSKYIYYIKRNNFNITPFGSDVLILSATVNKTFTECAFPNSTFIDLGQIKYQGKLYQVPARSLSRSCISHNRKGFTNYSKTLCHKYLGDDYNTITFPEFLPDEKTDKSINLWNCLGLDYLQDKDLAVVGTPHCPPIVYMLLCSVLHLNINNAYQDYRLVRRNGFEFYFQTYSNSFILSEIQLYMIESILMQCIGRARLINNPDRKVLLLSNFILPQAKVLNYNNQEVKELMQ